MRLAYLAPTVHHRHELRVGPVDLEWLLAQSANGDDVVVAVDEETPAVEPLRRAGIDVLVSPKRDVILADGSVRSADAHQSRLLADLHAESPFDTILVGAAMTTDPAWFERSLGEIPRGVVLGGGFTGSEQLIVDDASLFQHFGRRLWSQTGLLATADYLLSEVAPEVYGLDGTLLPPTLSTGAAVDPGRASRPRKARSLVVLAATAVPAAALGSLLPRFLDAVPVDPVTTTIVVIHGDRPVGPESSRELILDACPADLERNAILAMPGEDGVAAAFLEAADLVVAAGAADLAIPGVAAAAADHGYVLLGSSASVPPPLTATTLPEPGTPGSIVLLPVAGSPAEMAGILDRLDEDGRTDVVVLHRPEYAEQALRFVDYPRLGRADLAVLAAPEITHGSPNPSVPLPGILAASRRTWPSLRRRMQHTQSLEELAVWCLGLSLTEHIRLLVVPGEGEGFEPLPVEDVPGLPAWITSSGVLPRPNLAGVTTPAPEAPLDMMPSVREWAQTAGWRRRSRMVLPWKWGMLERAMKGRW